MDVGVCVASHINDAGCNAGGRVGIQSRLDGGFANALVDLATLALAADRTSRISIGTGVRFWNSARAGKCNQYCHH